MKTILHRRGLSTNIPIGQSSELIYTTDTEKLYYGGKTGNIELARKQDLTDVSDRLATTQTAVLALHQMESGKIKHYTSSGLSERAVKIYTGVATVVSDGAWSIDYTSAGFETVTSVHATPRTAASSTAAESPVGVHVTTFSKTAAAGRAHKGTAAGALVAMSSLWANATSTTIDVLVIGY